MSRSLEVCFKGFQWLRRPGGGANNRRAGGAALRESPQKLKNAESGAAGSAKMVRDAVAGCDRGREERGCGGECLKVEVFGRVVRRVRV